MKYTKQEKLDIGRKIYNNEMTRYEAADLYQISNFTARDYMRQYRDANNLPPKNNKNANHKTCTKDSFQKPVPSKNMEDYQAMTKDELIIELLKTRIAESRLKKGYAVKGDGTVILYAKKNIK